MIANCDFLKIFSLKIFSFNSSQISICQKINGTIIYTLCEPWIFFGNILDSSLNVKINKSFFKCSCCLFFYLSCWCCCPKDKCSKMNEEIILWQSHTSIGTKLTFQWSECLWRVGLNKFLICPEWDRGKCYEQLYKNGFNLVTWSCFGTAGHYFGHLVIHTKTSTKGNKNRE